MAYNYPYYQQPMQDQLAHFRQFQQPQQQQSGILWVQGEEAAKAYMVAPGNSVLLMDSENNSFYIKSSDLSGMPQPLRIFDYTERTAQTERKPVDYVTREEFEAFVAQMKKEDEEE